MTINPKLLEPTLLWANSNPANDFVTQGVTLSPKATDFRYVVIQWAYWKEWAGLNLTKMAVAKTSNVTVMLSGQNQQASEYISRGVYITNTGDMFFEACKRNGNNGADGFIVPIAIYGTNIL